MMGFRRRKHHLHDRKDAELNLIPLIDILSVMVAFLLVYQFGYVRGRGNLKRELRQRELEASRAPKG